MTTSATTMPELPGIDPGELPPVLYLPCLEHVRDVTDVRFGYRETRDGRLALLAWTALDRLKDGAGADQPWVLMPIAALGVLYSERPWDLLVVDPRIPEAARHGASERAGVTT